MKNDKTNWIVKGKQIIYFKCYYDKTYYEHVILASYKTYKQKGKYFSSNSNIEIRKINYIITT